MLNYIDLFFGIQESKNKKVWIYSDGEMFKFKFWIVFYLRKVLSFNGVGDQHNGILFELEQVFLNNIINVNFSIWFSLENMINTYVFVLCGGIFSILILFLSFSKPLWWFLYLYIKNHNNHLKLCGQVENSKWILCSRSTVVKCCYLRFW